MFGNGASLDLRGSFIATTADGVSFGSNGSFSAINPASDRLLDVQPGALFTNAIRGVPSQIIVDEGILNSTSDITIEANSLSLDRSFINAESNTRTGGNIKIKLNEFLSLSNWSQVSATAGIAAGSGNGGNIIIESPLILAFPQNNKIITRALSGSGGNIKIRTKSIFGYPQFLTIDASSELGIDGNINIDESIDLTKGISKQQLNSLRSKAEGRGQRAEGHFKSRFKLLLNVDSHIYFINEEGT